MHWRVAIPSHNMSKAPKWSFSQYFVHGLLSSSGSDLYVCCPVFPQNAQYTSSQSTTSIIQFFHLCYISNVQECNAKPILHSPANPIVVKVNKQ